MTHIFQAHGLTRPESAAAISRIRAAIDCYAGDGPDLDRIAATDVLARR